jgi:hypothetical protein
MYIQSFVILSLSHNYLKAPVFSKQYKYSGPVFRVFSDNTLLILTSENHETETETFDHDH